MPTIAARRRVRRPDSRRAARAGSRRAARASPGSPIATSAAMARELGEPLAVVARARDRARDRARSPWAATRRATRAVGSARMRRTSTSSSRRPKRRGRQRATDGGEQERFHAAAKADSSRSWPRSGWSTDGRRRPAVKKTAASRARDGGRNMRRGRRSCQAFTRSSRSCRARASPARSPGTCPAPAVNSAFAFGVFFLSISSSALE